MSRSINYKASCWFLKTGYSIQRYQAHSAGLRSNLNPTGCQAAEVWKVDWSFSTTELRQASGMVFQVALSHE